MWFLDVVSGKLGKNPNAANWESNDDLPITSSDVVSKKFWNNASALNYESNHNLSINSSDVISGKLGKTPQLVNQFYPSEGRKNSSVKRLRFAWFYWWVNDGAVLVFWNILEALV